MECPSWGLNSLLLDRSCLQSPWIKIDGKTLRNEQVPISIEIKNNLLWLASAFESSWGECFINSLICSPACADTILFVDTLSTGVGIWEPLNYLGSFSKFPPPSCHKFWAELLAIIIGIERTFTEKFGKILIHSDCFLCLELFSCHNTNPFCFPLSHQFFTIWSNTKQASRLNTFQEKSKVIVNYLSWEVFNFVSKICSSAMLNKIVFDGCLLQAGIIKHLVEFQKAPTYPYCRDINQLPSIASKKF